MPTSIQNLYTQSRSLQAYTQALQVTGQNIASSSDPNYTRQDVSIQPTLAGSSSLLSGSAVSSTVQDTRDQLVEAQIWREQSDLEFNNEQLTYLEQLEVTLFSGSNSALDLAADGGAYLADGLIKEVAGFLNSWADLEASPNDPVAKSAVYTSAQSMIDRFNSDAANLGELRTTLESGIESSVSTVNSLLSEVAALQKSISSFPETTSSAKISILNQRDQALSQLSEYISFSWDENSASPLESSLSVRTTSGSTIELITGSQVNDTLSWDSVNQQLSLTDAGTEIAVNGRIGAQSQLLTDELTDLQGHWDLLAGQMVTAVNAIYNSAGTDGLNFFDADSGTASSIRFEVGLDSGSIQAGIPSGNAIASAMTTLIDGDLGIAGISGSFTNDLINQQNLIANRIQSVQDKVTSQEKVVEYLNQEKSSRSGVDLDAEITNLLQFQRTFQATSRVLRALDESIQTFLSDIS